MYLFFSFFSLFNQLVCLPIQYNYDVTNESMLWFAMKTRQLNQFKVELLPSSTAKNGLDKNELRINNGSHRHAGSLPACFNPIIKY